MNKLKKIFLFTLIVYLLTELMYSSLFYFNLIEGDTIWFHEHTDSTGNFKFDSLSGYRISKTPATFGCYVENGTIQSYGILKGNNLGFPSKHDFYKDKKNKNKKRVVILGDSFTASQFTSYSWVDLVENHLNSNAAANDSIELWNMSVDGGGLANWWSIVNNILKKDSFDIDAIIIALLNTDLDRSFHVRNDSLVRQEWQHALFYSPSWNPDYFPMKSEGIEYFFIREWKIVDSPTAKSIISTKRAPEIKQKFDLKLTRFIYDFFRFKLIYYITDSKDFFKSGIQNGSLLELQIQLTNDISVYAKSQDIPILVFGIHTTDTIKTKQFCRILNADFIDATQGLYDMKLSIKQIEYKYNIKNDGHWKNEGVENFAEHNKYRIHEWIKNSINEN